MQLSTQWRVAAGMGGAMMLGLDYAAVGALFEMHGVGAEDRAALLRQIRVLEAAALETWSDGR